MDSKSNVSSAYRSFVMQMMIHMMILIKLSDEGPTLETLIDFTIRIGCTPTFLYFDMVCTCRLDIFRGRNRQTDISLMHSYVKG